MAKQPRASAHVQDFYEVMPYATGEPYVDNRDNAEHLAQQAKTLAIGTLIALGVLVIALALIIIKGISLVQG